MPAQEGMTVSARPEGSLLFLNQQEGVPASTGTEGFPASTGGIPSTSSSGFGSQMILSGAAATAFAAAEGAQLFDEAYLLFLEEEKIAQDTQQRLTQSYADSAYQTLHNQSQSEFQQSYATGISGGFNTAAPLAGGLSRLRSGPETNLPAIREAKTALTQGALPAPKPVSGDAAANPAAQNDAVVNKPAAELKSLLDVNFKDKNAITPQVLKDLQSLHQLKNSPDQVDQDLYKSVLSKIKDAEKSDQNAQQAHERKVDLYDNKLTGVGQGMGGAFSAIAQSKAAEARNDQANSQRNQTTAQFASDSTNQNVQTLDKNAQGFEQMFLETTKNNISGVAALSTAV